MFLLWTAIAGFFATQLYFAGLPWSRALSWTLPRWYSWGLVTPFIFRLDRRLAISTTLPMRLALHVPLAFGYVNHATAGDVSAVSAWKPGVARYGKLV